MSKQEQEVKRLLTALRREGKEGLTSNAIRVEALAAHKNYPCGPRNGEQCEMTKLSSVVHGRLICFR